LNCTSCQHDNEATARFCSACGARLERGCSGCGAALAEGARFCSQCGQPAENAAAGGAEASRESAGERRQLTVMFCDLVGSTELAQRLDPEDLREVLAAYQDACSNVVKRFEGHVAQFLGDGVLVYFGFPLAHEDDAERAVRAALEIQSALARLNEERRVADSPGLAEISARIGIHTGPVVVGASGDDAHQPLALGVTVNVASRLESLAEGGGVVISETTLGLVTGLFVTRALGTPELKGVAESIAVHAVERVTGVGGRMQPTHVTPLTGRDLEVGQLQDRWEQVQEGNGQVIAVSGEAGIGKSRLVIALRERLANSPHTWLELQCSPYASGSAFQPLIELYERGLRFDEHDTPEGRLAKLEAGMAQVPGVEPGEVVPYLAALLALPPSENFPLKQMSPELQRERTLQAMLAPFLAIESAQPVVLACEDLHWADPSTLDLLGHLIDQIPTLGVFLVLTYRQNFEPPWPLARSYVTPFALSRLTRRHTREMVAAASGGNRLPDRVLDEIVARADGVPLFAEELARSVADSGMLVESAGRYEFRGRVSDVTIPTTLQGSLMARLDRLSAAKQVAQLASTLGREFPYELIEAVSDLDVPTLRSGLTQLVSAEILYQRGAPPESSYTFKHALLQDTAYESQLKSRRRELHARIAGILEGRFPQRVAAEPERIARHCADGGLVEQAIAHYQRAGEQALARLANAEGTEYFGRALDALATLPENDARHQQEIVLRLALLNPLKAMRGYEDPDVVACTERIEHLIEAIGVGPQQLAGLTGLGVYHMLRGDFPNASRLAEQLLAIAEPLGIGPLRVASHMMLGGAAITAAPIDVACDHFARVVEIANSVELPPPTAVFDIDIPSIAAASQGIALILAGRAEQALAAFDSAIERVAKFDHVNSSASTQFNRAAGSYFLDDPASVIHWTNTCLETVDGLDFHTIEASSRVFRGWARVMEGDARGVEEVEDGLIRTEASGAMGGLVQLYVTAADAMIPVRRFERAGELADRAAATIERTQERHAFEPELLMFRAEILIASGEGTDAEIEALLLNSIELWHVYRSPWMELRSVLSLARLQLRTGRKAEARERLAALYARFTEGFETERLRDARKLLEELA
jgi:class 3 adenylate cyclase/tetratricopeptide (TPR) repeat protein